MSGTRHNNNPERVLLCRFTVRHSLADATLFGRMTQGRMFIAAVRFGAVKTYGTARAVSSLHPALVRCGRRIKGFLDGKVRVLRSLPLDFSGIPPFSKKVLLAARRIPYGKTVSYSRLAAMAGNPGAVRAAASVMRRNPFPLVIPCHRVIRNDGSIGGFLGRSKGRGVMLKRRLLKNERAAS
jgi:O-6-methylguanine DNA methyltransferase